ncbi:hypothetical protein [Microbispora triticiradicis]|uniref:hypothetical protein n=1 Tax=Microbispora triticiradicis TaxID=2200763 RepID=UPI001AD7D98A|nr:hypothetical protein [Microbispora triticiradicis]MBO4269812.1 hypothetical protein [Microbispora triticiradicis]
MPARLITTALACAVALAAVTTAAPRTASATAASAPALWRGCTASSCSFYFTSTTTAAMKRAADRADWLSGPTTDIICARVPNRLVALGCSIALLYPYNRARNRLNEAYALGGCFGVKAQLGFTAPVRFVAVPPGSSFCR